MKEYLILFRETESRDAASEPGFEVAHRAHWQQWFAKRKADGSLAGGSALTMNAHVIDLQRQERQGVYEQEGIFVGGFLLIRASSLAEATALVRDCPIYEAKGFAEVRELMAQA